MPVLTRRGNAHVVVLLSALASLLSLPAIGLAASGGGGLQGSSSSSSGSSGSSRSPGNPPTGRVSASTGGTTITTMAAGFLNSQIRFSGRVDSSHAGSTIEIELSGQKTGWTWTPTVQTRARGDGSFSVQWQANHIGQFSVRAVVSRGRGGGAAAGEPSVTIIVYRPAVATWYNQAGSTTACGVRLHANTLGVAHKTLPCGTKVAFYYHGKSIIVPVIDRGPYGGGRDWDLTEATAGYLGMKQAGVVTLGSVSLPTR
jgi:hypothetical protein